MTTPQFVLLIGGTIMVVKEDPTITRTEQQYWLDGYCTALGCEYDDYDATKHWDYPVVSFE